MGNSNFGTFELKPLETQILGVILVIVLLVVFGFMALLMLISSDLNARDSQLKSS